MKISADTITVESVRDIRATLAKASSQSFDLILKIDGKPTSNLSMMEVVDLLRGKVRTQDRNFPTSADEDLKFTAVVSVDAQAKDVTLTGP